MRSSETRRDKPVRAAQPFFPKQSEGSVSNEAQKNTSFFAPNPIQTKPDPAGQRSHGGSQTEVANASQNAENRTGLSTPLKEGLEDLSGMDLSGVRVHRNSSKPEAYNAHAYTQGEEIHLAPGQEKHLPHEGWHVVQQKQGRVRPTTERYGALLNDDPSLEQEADQMGAQALQGSSEGRGDQTNAAPSSQQSASVIQRAMKFEYQIKENTLYRDTGKGVVHPLPRKYGPRDYLVKGNSGVRLESETGGQPEFETSWEKDWSKLSKQIGEAQWMCFAMGVAPEVTASNKKKYKKFPFFGEAIKHLTPDQGFSTSGGVWNKTQHSGDAEVNKPKEKKENVRSSKSYESPDNIIGTVDHGEEVFVRYINGNWARIKTKKLEGWMWKHSLKMETKRYESNTEGSSSDTPLQKKEQLLVGIGDSKWTAYIQLSESFGLEQFESYLKQYEKEWASKLVGGTKQYMLEHNTQEVPKGESAISRIIREEKYIQAHIKLKNLLLMVGYYIEKGRTQSTKYKSGKHKGEPGPAKWAFSLMSRTHFGSIFKSLSKEEQTIFTKMVYDKKTGIIPTMKLTTSSKMFVDGTGTGYNPTVYAWLVSITQGKDILSSQTNSVSGAMGRHNLQDEKGKNKDLVRFEGRRTSGNSQTLWKWDDHAYLHFKMAMWLRSRATGKGETGLEM